MQSAALRYVVLDLGGVVCRFDPGTRLRALERLSGRSGAEIHAAIWESGLDHQAELGKLDAATLRSRLLAALGGNVDADTLRTAWSQDRFAHVFLSWQLGATKPEPAAYDAVTAQLAVDGSQLLFFDDSLENVSAARSLGWQAEVFTDVRALEQQLADAGALESA